MGDRRPDIGTELHSLQLHSHSSGISGKHGLFSGKTPLLKVNESCTVPFPRGNLPGEPPSGRVHPPWKIPPLL